MDFFTIQKKLRELNLEIFTLNDIIKITGQKRTIAKNKLSLLAKQQKIYRVKRGYYSLSKIESKFQLQKIYKDTYISLYSSLEYYESTTQRYNNLDLITKKVLYDTTIDGTAINFHKVKNSLFFGYKKIMVNNTEAFISNIEKTIIDCLYFSSKVHLSEVVQFIKKYWKKINLELLEEYLAKIGSSSLNKRAGYLLERENILLKNVKINNKYEKLNTNKNLKGPRSTKWKLIINEEL